MKPYTKKQYYTIGGSVYRNGSLITVLQKEEWAKEHVETLNKRYGDPEAYELLNSIRDEITLYEDGDFSAKAILESVKAMLDSREKN
jgi:hypothetical protein